MKHSQKLFLVILMVSSAFAARPTFVNLQTVDGIIHYPTIITVSETEITLATGTVVNIADVNSVMAYGQTNSFFPCLIGAGCGYLGLFPGCLFAVLIFPTSMTQGDNQIGAMMVMYGTAALSGYYAYRRTAVRASERSQTMVFMGGWSLEQKRNFFVSALPPS